MLHSKKIYQNFNIGINFPRNFGEVDICMNHYLIQRKSKKEAKNFFFEHEHTLVHQSARKPLQSKFCPSSNLSTNHNESLHSHFQSCSVIAWKNIRKYSSRLTYKSMSCEKKKFLSENWHESFFYSFFKCIWSHL